MRISNVSRPVRRLIYVSSFSPSFPKHPADQDDEISYIIRSSIQHNRQADITGFLLVHHSRFLQVLEGRPDAVMDTYARIAADPRHCGAKILTADDCDSRRFANWNMCARRTSATDDGILQTLDLGGAFDPDALGGGAALALLLAVRNIQLRETAG